MGTGITAGAALDHPLDRLTVAELVPEVVDLARRHFAAPARGLFEDPRVRLVVDDGRHVLRHAQTRYDVVVGDLFFPWQPGTAYLYTREHLESVKAKLAPGGHFAQWLPCYQLGPEELRGILATFVEVFPRVTLWRGDFFADRPILAVTGHADATPLDPDALVEGARRLVVGDGQDLAEGADVVPFHLYVGNLTQARDVLRGARPLTDDRPWIQWTAPQSERVHRVEDPPTAVRHALVELEAAVRESSPVDEDPHLVRLDARQRGYVEAGLAARRMAVGLKTFRRLDHARALREYVRRVPGDVRPDLSRWIE
jgi:spermidine synthase